ncbi:MAG: sigma-E processing peptidase SpoIIGA [Erysipelotrichaceae bacterium]|nr:sigma-E processing peptidase SpoIIGA [Erysipelotrichaceae bacterium]
MQAYLDLSLIVFIFNLSLSFIYSLIIFDKIKYQICFITTSIFIGIVSAIINVLFIPYFFIFINVLYGLFLAIFDLKYLKIILTFLIIFYINYGFLLLIGGCFLYKGILLISIPFISLFILIEPLYITIIYLLSNIIYKYFKYKKFKLKCKIFVENKQFKGMGYYDTGNCLTYNSKPVIFIKGHPFSNQGEVIRIKGINDCLFTYLAYNGKILINKYEKDVYVVFINNNVNFNDCQFLLNKYII